MLTSMSGEIALPVAVDIEPPDHPPALYRLLPDGGAYGAAMPRDVAGKSYTYGYQRCHVTIFPFPPSDSACV